MVILFSDEVKGGRVWTLQGGSRERKGMEEGRHSLLPIPLGRGPVAVGRDQGLPPRCAPRTPRL